MIAFAKTLLHILTLSAIAMTSASQTVHATQGTRSLETTPILYSPTQKVYYNATQQKYITAWGVEAYITWTDPSLNGGTFSAHRVILNQLSPWRYTEVGWAKFSTGLFLFVTYDDGIAGPQTQYFPNLSPSTHLYSSQYDPTTQQHWFYLDSSPFFNRSMNFATGDRVVGGGEVYDGIESMGGTQLSELAYSVNTGGNFYFFYWNGYERYVEDYPYCNISNGPSSFYDVDCRYRIFLPLVLNQ